MTVRCRSSQASSEAVASPARRRRRRRQNPAAIHEKRSAIPVATSIIAASGRDSGIREPISRGADDQTRVADGADAATWAWRGATCSTRGCTNGSARQMTSSARRKW